MASAIWNRSWRAKRSLVTGNPDSVITYDHAVQNVLFMLEHWQRSSGSLPFLSKSLNFFVKLDHENTDATHTARLFLRTLSLVAFTAIFVSQDFSISFQPTVVQVSALWPRRLDILGTL